MSATPGNKFAIADLSGLVAPSSATNYGLTHFEDVSPMYLDGGGANWGHRVVSVASGLAINAPGSGYVVGDMVSLGYGTSFEIVAVVGGGVAAIRIIAAGAGQYTDPADISGSPTGGSGSGLSLYAPFVQYGPSAAYAFPDFMLNSCTLTGLVVVAGGSGYVVGDTLQLADFPGLTVTVTGVSAGAITAATVPTTANISAPTDFAALVSNPLTGSGTGAQFSGQFTFPQRPAWLAELNRLRAATEATLAQHLDSNDPNLAVSGPWPVAGASASNKQNAFYYAAATNNGVVTQNANYLGTAYGPVPAAQIINNYCTLLTGFGSTVGISLSKVGRLNAMTATIVIGGNAPVLLQGDFFIAFAGNQGLSVVAADAGFTTDGHEDYTLGTPTGLTDPTVSIDSSGWIGSVSWNQNYWSSPYAGYLISYCHVNQMVSPGRYTVVLTSTCAATDDTFVYSGTYPNYTLTLQPRAFIDQDSESQGLVCAPLNWCSPTNNPFRAGNTGVNISNTWTGGTAYPGVHNSLPVWKLDVSGLGGLIPGIFMAQQAILNLAASQTTPWPAPIMGPETLKPATASAGLGTNYTGFWTAICQAISNLNLAHASQMPWNLIRTKYGSSGSANVNPMLLADQAPSIANVAKISNSYDQTLTCEAQLEPPAWIASRYFTAAFTIMDGNGNFQKATIAGVTGATTPAWSTTAGGSTTDGAVTWTCVYKPASAIARAQHRIPDLPRYPIYWYSETITALLPPTSTSGNTIWGANNQWQRNSFSGGHDNGWQQDNLAYGWWIYSVSLNRMENAVKALPAIAPGGTPLGVGDLGATGVGSADLGATGVGAGASAASAASTGGEVSVAIGCMRNGAFVAFGTYITGQTVQVLWPVFTSDALVYQCGERVDIQAAAIAGDVSTGATASKPICAAFVTDTLKLLSLIT